MAVKNFIFTLYIVSAFILINLGCNQHVVTSKAGSSMPNLFQESLKPEIEVKVIDPVVVNNRLNFKWEIKNTTEKPVYIYSSLFENNAFAEIVLKREAQVIEIRFLGLYPSPALPYYFPKSTFTEILPEQLIQGRFISKEDVGTIISSKLDHKDVIKIMASLDKWSVQCLVAFGKEIESVQRELEQLKKNGITEHPINLIIRWQKIASSEPVKITLVSNSKNGRSAD